MSDEELVAEFMSQVAVNMDKPVSVNSGGVLLKHKPSSEVSAADKWYFGCDPAEDIASVIAVEVYPHDEARTERFYTLIENSEVWQKLRGE